MQNLEKMPILVVGASGATGKSAVDQLLTMGHSTRVIVRHSSIVPEHWQNNDNVEITRANISQMSIEDMANLIKDCQGAISCLGHNLNLKGIFGKPRGLVADATRLICDAVRLISPVHPFKFVLMNTVGCRNKELNEQYTFAEKIVMSLVRNLVPPQADNEKAADYLMTSIGKSNPLIEWVTVRPDTLINQDEVTNYELHISPTRSGIFNPGKTSRINVGNFMARLFEDADLWQQWKWQMPVLYNS